MLSRIGLPTAFSWIEALHITDVDAPSARGFAVSLKWTIRGLWEQFHGRPMGDDDAAAIKGT
jgi:hypothetical protein